jgi:hypothetical protein
MHDLRHSFAVASVLDWYRTGADAPAMMPRLATYLLLTSRYGPL